MYFDFKTRCFKNTKIENERIALYDKEHSISWSKLKETVENIQSRFRALKIKKGHPIFIKGDDSFMQVAFFLACVSEQYIYVPIHQSTPATRLEELKNKLNSNVLVHTQSEPNSFEIEIIYKNFDLQIFEKTQSNEYKNFDEQIVYIIFTSGSTGTPKAVPITLQNIISFLASIENSDMRVLTSDKIVNTFNFSFDGSLFVLLPCLQKGATCILDTNVSKTDFISSLNPNIWAGTPSALKLTLISPWFTKSVQTLNKFWLAGESLTVFLAKKLLAQNGNFEIWNNYGPTETTITVSNCKITNEILLKYPTLPIASGNFSNNIELINTKTVENKVYGEIQIYGQSVSPGYLGLDKNESFLTNNEGQRVFKTGDYAFIQDGFLFFNGRLDSQIKFNGHRLDLSEIEYNVLKSGYVETCVCLPIKVENEVKKIVCFYEPQTSLISNPKNLEMTSYNILNTLKEILPSYMLPHELIYMDKLPLNKNLKVDNEQLLNIYHSKRQ